METNYLIAQSYRLSNLRALNFNQPAGLPKNLSPLQCHSFLPLKAFLTSVVAMLKNLPTELEHHLFEYGCVWK